MIYFLGLLYQITTALVTKTTGTDSFAVLEARSPTVRCQQGTASRGSQGESVPGLLLAAGCPGLWTHHSRLCLPAHTAFSSVCSLSLGSFYKDS